MSSSAHVYFSHEEIFRPTGELLLPPPSCGVDDFKPVYDACPIC